MERNPEPADMFQSLKGILEGFAWDCLYGWRSWAIVSIPERDFRRFRERHLQPQSLCNFQGSIALTDNLFYQIISRRKSHLLKSLSDLLSELR